VTVSPSIVGRDGELAGVRAFLAAAADGFAALVLEGEAGIGKTTVWREAEREADALGARVLSCRPSASEAKLSFAALADLLSPVEDDVFVALPDPQRDALMVALLRAAHGTKAPSARAVATGVLTVVRELASSQLVVLAIDDAHWLRTGTTYLRVEAVR
jgi:hypothetical protein